MDFWNEEKIAFYQDAAEQLRFHRLLARRAVKYISPGDSVCDAGCGLGYLALELAGSCADVTAVDIDPRVLAVLEENVAARGVRNVKGLCADVFALPEETVFDTMVFCFFGGVEDALRCAAKHCRGTVLIYKKDWACSRFQLGRRPLRGASLAVAETELAHLGVPYGLEEFSVDMGQPFRSVEEAAAFFRLYDRTGCGVEEAAVRAKLVESDRPGFPWYLPAERPVALLTLRAEDIRRTVR